MKVYIEKAKKEYEGREVLDVGNLTFEEGYIYAVLGLNGSGKTTLLECTAGINKLSSGKILYNGSPHIDHVKQDISIMMQKPYLFNASVAKNIEIGLKFRKLGSIEIGNRLKKYLKYFDIENMMSKNARKLSGGECAKVAMLRTAVLETSLTLFDEPAASMDIESTLEAEKLIKDISGSGKTVVLVTHDLYQARRIADYIIFMDRGKIIEMGPKRKLLNNPENKLVKLILNIGYV